MAEQRTRHDRFHGRVSDAGRACEHPGCAAQGDFRAPRRAGGAGNGKGDSRWHWLCLDHVRAFNAAYNYFEGMDTDEIDRAQKLYAGWETETRAFAAGGASPPPRWASFTDPADLMGTRFGPRATAPADGLNDADRRALKTLGLGSDASRADIRRAYAERLRRFHPDRNGGDRRHEQALQAAISAYTHLKTAPAFALRS